MASCSNGLGGPTNGLAQMTTPTLFVESAPRRLKCRISSEGEPRADLIGRNSQPSPELYKHFRGHKDQITAVFFHPNLPRVVSGSKDGYVMSWDYNDDSTRVLRFEGHSKPVTDVAMNRDGDLLFSSSEDATIRVWVPIMRGDSYNFKGHHSTVTSMACSPESPTEFVSSSTDKCIKFWSLSRLPGKPPRCLYPTMKLQSHAFLGSHSQNHWVLSVRYQPGSNGHVVCTSAANATLSIIDNRAANLVTTIKSTTLAHVKYAEFNPASTFYIGACGAGRLQIYDIRTQKLVQIYMDLHTDDVSQFSFHPSGDFAYTAGEDKKIKIVDLVEGRPIFTLVGPTEGIRSIATSPDGSLFATGGRDKNLLVWKPFLTPYSADELKEREEGGEDEDTFPDEDEDSTLDSSDNFHAQPFPRKTI